MPPSCYLVGQCVTIMLSCRSICHHHAILWVSISSSSQRVLTPPKGLQRCWFNATLLMPRKTAAVSAHILCTTMQQFTVPPVRGHICRVHVCSAVTCHLHIGQNDRDLLRAAGVGRIAK